MSANVQAGPALAFNHNTNYYKKATFQKNCRGMIIPGDVRSIKENAITTCPFAGRFFLLGHISGFKIN
jgi:hypothetical protein